MRYLGIDYGDRKVGIALSDESGTMGFPRAIVPNTPRLAVELAALIAKENVGAAVIGESKDYAGRDNPVAEDARKLGASLEKLSGIPVAYHCETLTTQEARRPPEKQGKTRALKRRASVDASAAALILTSFLTRQKGG